MPYPPVIPKVPDGGDSFIHGVNPNMLNVSTPHAFPDSMFGLPLLTIVSVGGLALIIVIALILWGLTFKETAS